MVKKKADLIFAGASAALMLAVVQPAQADGIVGKVTGSPLNATGLVKGGPSLINIYLQKPGAEGIEFYDPKIPGFGIPPGGRIEVEMAEGFERDPGIAMDTGAVHMVSGTPQQGLSSRAIGYVSKEGANKNTFYITAPTPAGLPAEKLLPRATVKKLDPIPNIGLKTFHIGLSTVAFRNVGDVGTVKVRIIDGSGAVTASGSAPVRFFDTELPQIHPNNFLNQGRNHNWQRIKPGDVLGKTVGTVPLTFMLFDKPNGSPAQIRNFKGGIIGVGVLSTQQLRAMNYSKPAPLARYNGGLIVRDTDGNGDLDPQKDQIIGGVKASAPSGAKGQEARSLNTGGKPLLSQPTGVFSERAGKRIGGAIMQVQFTGGSKAGKYRPTFALLKDPKDLNSGDGTAYTYTIVVE
ncbi:MAG: hypothetical protein O3A84_10405 [Proteobacteria bacterium]|nr:hypothetical protein [Pseudomonadota bacterium]